MIGGICRLTTASRPASEVPVAGSQAFFYKLLLTKDSGVWQRGAERSKELIVPPFLHSPHNQYSNNRSWKSRQFDLANLRLVVSLMAMLFATAIGQSADLSPMEELGKRIFFDKNLSNPAGQSCASCHAPETGFTGPDSDINLQTAVYPGASAGKYGNRKPPSVAYMSFSPKRTYNKEDETWVGGQFYDGRANDLIEQAKGPFLNPLEMNNASAAEVVGKVRSAGYRDLFTRVFGRSALDANSVDSTFDMIARAIAAYETSREVNSFSSKYDAYLAKRVTLSPQEMRGLELYAGKANCAACHPHGASSDGTPPLFTDFTYDNLGVPRNEHNPFYRADQSANPDGHEYRDLGIGAIVKDVAHNGKFKVPTLRNVAKKPSADFVKAYLHNGSFKSLKEVVHFYNKRLQDPNQFPAPEFPDTVNKTELGNLGLTDQEEDDLIAFLETLTDLAPASSSSNDVATHPEPRPHAVSKGVFQRAGEFRRVERFRERVIQASKQNQTWR